MSQSIFDDNNWIKNIRQQATAKGLTLSNMPGTGLSFHATATNNVVGVRNVNFNIGGVLLTKVSLNDLLDGVKIDMLLALGTERIKLLGPETILTEAFKFLGLTGVTSNDFTYTSTDTVITYYAKSSCVKFTGSFEVTYAN